MNIDPQIATKSLAALGHEVRLHIFRLLVKAGDEGLTVGAIGAHLGMPASTLAHHLSALVHAGLVVQERQSRTIINRVDFDQMNGVISFLSEECCQGVDAAANSNVA